MKMTTTLALVTSGLLFASAFTANADIRVRCEKRADRSVISVDGFGIAAGTYRAQVISGPNQKTSPLPGKRPVAGQVEFDFSSQPNDIAAGAVAIGPSFIRNGTVTGKILRSTGTTVVSDTVRCRVR